jgi:hypothetical protein
LFFSGRSRKEEVGYAGDEIERKDGAPDKPGHEASKVGCVPESGKIADRVDDDREGEIDKNVFPGDFNAVESSEKRIEPDSSQTADINAQATAANSQRLAEKEERPRLDLMADGRKNGVNKTLPG